MHFYMLPDEIQISKAEFRDLLLSFPASSSTAKYLQSMEWYICYVNSPWGRVCDSLAIAIPGLIKYAKLWVKFNFECNAEPISLANQMPSRQLHAVKRLAIRYSSSSSNAPYSPPIIGLDTRSTRH